jgi:hypothetical protein
MTSEPQSHSGFYQQYVVGVDNITAQNKDSFHNQLYFANMISLMEKYLSDLFIHEISTNQTALVKLASHKHFKSMSLKIPFLLHNRVEDYMINAMKSMVWHRLNDVEMFYKNVLDIQFNTSRNLLDILKTRHHLVHRNGFDLDNSKVDISENKLNSCIGTINGFIVDIDKKYQAYQNA